MGNLALRDSTLPFRRRIALRSKAGWGASADESIRRDAARLRRVNPLFTKTQFRLRR
jgi:hypothetical protein